MSLRVAVAYWASASAADRESVNAPSFDWGDYLHKGT
jgi:hypothetical protein